MLRRRHFAAMNGPDCWTYSSLCGGCAESWLASFVVEAECWCERSLCLPGWTRVGCCFGDWFLFTFVGVSGGIVGVSCVLVLGVWVRRAFSVAFDWQQNLRSPFWESHGLVGLTVR